MRFKLAAILAAPPVGRVGLDGEQEQRQIAGQRESVFHHFLRTVSALDAPAGGDGTLRDVQFTHR